MAEQHHVEPEQPKPENSIASLGGKASAESLTPEERKDRAKKAAEARWSGQMPWATHAGVLQIKDRQIACAVLNTRKRVLTQETFLTAIGRAAKAKAGTGSTQMVDGLPPFLVAENLNRFITDDLRQSTTPFLYRTLTGGRAFGYDAMLLPMVCEVYLDARDAEELLPSQAHIAVACDLLMRGLARVGIVALVDEATGYQEERARDELIKILEAYITPELMPWTKRFPDHFFREIYRVHKWEYKPGTAKRTPLVGHLINRYIYDPLPPGVLDELRAKNPVTEKGYRKHKHFQFLTPETGCVHLDKQITAVSLILKISDSKKDFEENFKRAFGVVYQPSLPLIVSVDDEAPSRKPKSRKEKKRKNEERQLFASEAGATDSTTEPQSPS